jgi:hypothetical protein
MGERPTNPDLLEYLASSFVKNGMSIKKLTREIMLSSVYQLSTQNDESNFARDSGSRMYWRFNRRRMDAEELRDSVLTVSGNLDDSLGGPSEDLTPAFKRRTVYGKVSRYKLDTYLQTFDFPPPNISAEKRFTTTVPLQRLFLMNSDFMQVEAEGLAKRVAGEPDNRARIRKAYQMVYARDPSEAEMKLGLEYLHSEPLKEYEENKNKPPEGGAGGRGPRGGDAITKETSPKDEDVKTAGNVVSKPEASAIDTSEGGTGGTAEAVPENAENENAAMGMGMFGGVPGMGGRRGNAPGAAPEIKYDPSAWGRYAKILLSSSEFLFIN